MRRRTVAPGALPGVIATAGGIAIEKVQSDLMDPSNEPEPAGVVLELQGVSKVYGASPGVEALKNVDLAVRRGELVAIVGPSGSGKSTLLHIIGTLERPTSGSVLIAGQNVEGMSDRRLSGLRGKNIGFVFQQFFLLEGMTAVENVAGGLLYQGLGPKERMRLADDALERVGMANRRGHHPCQLSGGERQRVAIARAIAGRPSIVLADEPTGNLDSVTGRDIFNLLRRLNDEGATIAIITHDRDMAAALPRRVELRDGFVIYDGPGDDLERQSSHNQRGSWQKMAAAASGKGAK